MQEPTPDWASLLQWPLWAIAVGAVMAWVARSRSRAAAPHQGHRLAQPTGTLVIGVAAFLLFGAITVVSNAFANSTTTWWTTAIFVGFALMGLWMVGSYFAERHNVSEEGMTHRRLMGGRRDFLQLVGCRAGELFAQPEVVPPGAQLWTGRASVSHEHEPPGARASPFASRHFRADRC